MLKGFMIFLIATDEPVSWSFAELRAGSHRGVDEERRRLTIRDRTRLDEGSHEGSGAIAAEDSPIPTGWRSTYLVVTCGGSHLGRRQNATYAPRRTSRIC